MMAIIKLMSGWKLVAAYLLMNLPFLVDHPVLYEALKEVIANPNRVTIGALLVQVLAVVGLMDRIRKNLLKNGRNDTD
jgi:hypothetical protein